MRRSPALKLIFAARSSDAPPACPTPRHMPPAELSVAQRVALAVLRAYKVAVLADVCGLVPVRAVVFRVRGRSGRATRRRSRVLPGGTPAGALQSFRRAGLDPVPGAGGETR